jgi:transcription antitermination factor NusG
MHFIDHTPQASGRPRWYAIQTRSNFEKAVDRELRSKEIHCYLPVLQEVHRWKDREKLIERPLFPGYVFASFADERAVRLQVMCTNGAVRILGGATAIEPIPESEIANVRRLLASGEGAFAHPYLREGCRVRVKRGPLKGVEGILERFSSRARLVLSIELLSRSVATEIEIRDVEPVAQSWQSRPEVPGLSLANR